MSVPDPASWPTLLFRAMHPSEAELVGRLLDVSSNDELRIYVLTEAGRLPPAVPRAAVALDVRDRTWLIRAAFGVDDPLVATRVGCDLLAEAVRAGASTVATPVEAPPACRAVLADRRATNRGGWLVAEL